MSKQPVELVSDIVARAAQLHAHGDQAAIDALRVHWEVNPEVLGWLRAVLGLSVPVRSDR